MKLAEIDWPVLSGGLIILAISVIVSGAMIGGSQYFWDEKQQALRKTDVKLRDIKNKYTTIDDEERIIEEYLPRFQALEAQGIIGRERRLNWIEVLREASRDLKLPELRYSIQTQTRYQPDFPLETGAFDLYSTIMELNLGLLHEGDLPRLLALIDRDAVGLYSVSRCNIAREAPEFLRQPTATNLSATCALRWFTVKQPQAGG